MDRYENKFYGEVKGSAFGVNAQVNNYYGESEFLEVTVEELENKFKKSHWVKLDIVNHLLQEKILVLSGDLGVDKNELALEIAFILANNIRNLSIESSNSDILIKKWKKGSNKDFIDIDDNIEPKNTNTTIFILTEVEPQNIGSYHLKKIYGDIKNTNYYVLISTERSFTSWHLEESCRSFFPDLKIENIYDDNALLKQFKEQVSKEKLEQYIALYLSNKDEKLLELVKKLRTPRNIIRFVEIFRQKIINNNGNPHLLDIESLIKIAKNDEEFIRKLYYEILDPSEQLLALGLGFFNGLFEDQLFAALERVVEEVWQKRDPSLRALDYCDLEKLKDNYFELSLNDYLYEVFPTDFKVVDKRDYKVDVRSIKMLSLENRSTMFKIAWENHRRQIITALDVLVTLVQESVAEENYSSKWELYGDPMRRERLRSVVSETLSEIGSISTSALSIVQGSLLQLAKGSDFNVRLVAASTIARWYNLDAETNEAVFRTLQRFYCFPLKKESQANTENWNIISQLEKYKNIVSSNKWILDLNIIWIFTLPLNIYKNILNIFRKHRKLSKQNYYIADRNNLYNYDYIGSTVAITIGETIDLYFGKEELSDEFYKWLEELSKSRLLLVHVYFGYHTLSKVVPLHFHDHRIQKMLKNLSRIHTEIWDEEVNSDYSLNHAIAYSLSCAYSYPENYDDIIELLEKWYEEGSQNDSNDGLLKTIALTYGLLEYSDKDKFTVNQAFSRLIEMLNKKQSNLVRDAIISAIINLSHRYFNLIEYNLQSIVKKFTKSERDKLVLRFTKIYLEQRSNMSGGDEKMNFNGHSYPIWINQKNRPLTEIETAMYRWIRKELARSQPQFKQQKKQVNITAAQKVALAAFTSFAINLDMEEERYIQYIKG